MLCLAIHLCRVLRPRQRQLWSWRWQQSRQALKNDMNTIYGILVSLISTLTTRGRQKLHSGAWTRSRCRSLPSEGRRGRSTWTSSTSTPVHGWSGHRMLFHPICCCFKNQKSYLFLPNISDTMPATNVPTANPVKRPVSLLGLQINIGEFNSISGLSAYI